MGAGGPPPRRAKLVLVTRDGTVVGRLPPVPVATPWWQDALPVVRAVRERLGVDVTILRILESEREAPPGGLVTYLGEVPAPVAAEPWSGRLDDQPLRLAYARPGGPAADLAWAEGVLAGSALRPSGRPEQVRTWNLSSLWRIPVGEGSAWLKVVPPFFAHEGAVIERLAGEAVPRLLGRDGPRMLLAAIAGDDLYEASPAQLLAMVDLLVALQRRWIGRTAELLAAGTWDWRAGALLEAIGSVYGRWGAGLADHDRRVLDPFVASLPERLAAVDACGLPDTLVHGDFHPGNLRGAGDRLTLLDWGDSGVGHPLLDSSAFMTRIPPSLIAGVRERWLSLWRSAVPASDPARAWDLLRPVAAARQAAIYAFFLDHIEPAEHGYHRLDPAAWLAAAASRLRSPEDAG